ncbi:MAG: ISL3 family transposase [Pseudomonadota bacterium]
MPDTEATAQSIRALFDLPRYGLIHVKRWAGWGQLTLVSKRPWFRCPLCCVTCGPGQPCRWRLMRDLDIGRRHIELRVQVYRIQCRPCGRPVVPTTLARPYARCTRRLEQHLFRLTGDSTVKAVATRMALDWETVKGAEVRYIRGLLRKRNLDGIRRIGIDEVSYRRGHKYLTLVTDLDHHRVIYATYGNDGKAISRFLAWFGPERCRRIKVVVTDMHDPYIKVLRKHLPSAALVFDHYHVSKVIHDALDQIRRRLQRQLPVADRRILKGQRYVLLRARENLTKKQQVSLRELLDANTDLTAGYVLKEAFRDVFTSTNRRTGKKRLKVWEAQVRESGVPELIKVLETIDRRRSGIENFFQYRVANGMAEGFNNVVGTIKKQAYGFHDREYLRLKILRVCGKLE